MASTSASSAASFVGRLGAKPPSSPTAVIAPALQHLLQVMKDLHPHAQRLREVRRAAGHHHELLHVDVVVRVRPTVDEVHERHRQEPRRRPAQVAVQRQPDLLRRRPRRRQRDPQKGVRPELGLVRRPVERDHRLVDRRLLRRVQPDHRRAQHLVHMLHRPQHSLAQVAAVVAISQLQRLVGARRRPRGDRGAPEGAAGGDDVHFQGRIATRIQDLSRCYRDDLGHGKLLFTARTFAEVPPPVKGDRQAGSPRCGQRKVRVSLIFDPRPLSS